MDKTVIKLDRIGDGTEEDPFRPDINTDNWKVIEDGGDFFMVEVLKEEE